MPIDYSHWVDYATIDPVKGLAQRIFASTLIYPEEKYGIKIIPESVGHTAAVFDVPPHIRRFAVNGEGLGTKIRVQDSVTARDLTYYSELKEKFGIVKQLYKHIDDPTIYRPLGQDTAAMSVNDLAGVGADPILWVNIIAAGDSRYFEDIRITEQIFLGMRDAADVGRFAIPQGETPVLSGVVYPATLDLVGFSVGVIYPEDRTILGDKLKEGQIIAAWGSSGIHSNGLSMYRGIANLLPQGHFTQLPDGTEIYKRIIKPTPIYSKMVKDLFDEGVRPSFIQPITGHGFRKIMRVPKDLAYVIEELPEPQPEFTFLQDEGKKLGFNTSDEKMYETFNMGIGFVVIGDEEIFEPTVKIGKRYGLETYRLGTTKKGTRRVEIKPKNIVYTPKG
jgi:phosphoribosylformylglycinamidine cyclo-ligase